MKNNIAGQAAWQRLTLLIVLGYEGLGLGSLTIWFIFEIIILKEFHWLHAMWGLPVLAGIMVTIPLVISRRR